MTDLKQQVREAVESLRNAAIDMCLEDKNRALNIADFLEAAAAAEPDTAKPIACVACEDKPRPPNDPCAVCGKSAEPEYEVRWTWGNGAQTFNSEYTARLHASYRGPGDLTVRRVFIEPIPPAPEPELSVEDATSAFLNAACRVKFGGEGLDAARKALEDLDRARARERGA